MHNNVEGPVFDQKCANSDFKSAECGSVLLPSPENRNLLYISAKENFADGATPSILSIADAIFGKYVIGNAIIN